jgi:hypothetical protein
MTRFGFVMEDSYFIPQAMPLSDGNDFRPLDARFAAGQLLTIADSQHLAQLDFITRSYAQSGNFKFLAGTDRVLFAPGFNYGVNRTPPNIPVAGLSSSFSTHYPAAD